VIILRGALASALFAVSGCGQLTEPATVPGPQEDPRYAIYSVILDSLFLQARGSGRTPAQFVVIDSTAGKAPDFDNWVRAEFVKTHPAEFGAVVEIFAKAEPSRVHLEQSRFSAAAPVTLVSRQQLSAAGLQNPRDYWDAFYARYPGARGRIFFGSPSIDATGTYALVWYGHGCGGLCGDYGYVLLESRRGRWIILKRVITVVS
jgi:hypothetical protein